MVSEMYSQDWDPVVLPVGDGSCLNYLLLYQSGGNKINSHYFEILLEADQ